ncbi:MAG: Na+/H+ antiporter NhaC, partial [Negativicutes bacterium]|nr:Na+/H+ antiporter NhaC [Negativicutes bacterium]
MLQKPSLFCSLLPLLFMFGLISVGSLFYKMPLSFLLIVAAVFTGLLARGFGLSWAQMLEGIAVKVKQTSQGLLVVLCVGGLISSWMISGTIPMFIYYGIKLIDPQYFYVTAFLVTAMASTVTGTSFGSAGTIGVSVMGVAIAQGLSLPITAGAVISGAIFGDKMSPCSDTTILASLSTNTDLYKHIKHMLYTTGAATFLSLFVYAVAGISMPVVPQ